ncbi:segregation and condensation protein B [Actinoplanes tereljensis]|uniref:Segregation and condensation protein B n=1 Tax=Paractinoplanes tereljensis TaxID=571912 RepID=A0A919NWW9_9ACTN|nr:hypothetical protein Ate02nite_95740 [Actinoplanes tereljensis]
MSDDERPDTLADQAAAWVPPWERQQRPPDRAYQAAAEQEARRGKDPESADDEELSEAGLADDDDDFDEEFEGANPPGYNEPDEDEGEDDEEEGEDEPGDLEPERPALGDDESVSVDAPVEVEDEPAEVAPEPSEAEIGPVLELPEAVEEAVLVAPPELARAAAVPEQARGKRGGAAAVVEVDARTAGDAEPDDLPDLADDAELTAALEAILLVVDEPVAEMQLAQILEQPTERVGLLLEDISARYTAAGHGFDLRRAAGGWRLYTRPEYAAYVERFVLDGQSVRLTQAALETLAVVAYKQPVTRSRISAIRGVNCDGVMRTLATRGLIEECGVEGETGAHLYRTTDLFLEKLGLNSVDQLPPLAPFLPDDVEEVLDAPG